MARPAWALPLVVAALRLQAAAGQRVHGGASGGFNGPLLGEYGFFSQFSGITAKEARERVRAMHQHFGIMEFELRDAFEEFSRPPALTAKQWGTPLGTGRVERKILEAITSEVKSIGGRTWLVVNSMAINPNDGDVKDRAKIAGSFDVGERTLMDVVVPDAQWAKVMAPAWAKWAESLGCSGIHWSSMGDFDDAGQKGADVSGFLTEAHKILKERELQQMANFPDGFGWESSLVDNAIVAFAYWVVFDTPDKEDLFYQVTPKGSVVVLYPGTSEDHSDEPWNRFVVGIRPLEVMIFRWQRARCHGDSYLAVGDGMRRVTSDYAPMAREMSEGEIQMVREQVFGSFTCNDGTQMEGQMPEEKHTKLADADDEARVEDDKEEDKQSSKKERGKDERESREHKKHKREKDEKQKHEEHESNRHRKEGHHHKFEEEALGFEHAKGKVDAEKAAEEANHQHGHLVISLSDGEDEMEDIQEVIEDVIKNEFGYRGVALDQRLPDDRLLEGGEGGVLDLAFEARCRAECLGGRPPRTVADSDLAVTIQRALEEIGSGAKVAAAALRVDSPEDAASSSMSVADDVRAPPDTAVLEQRRSRDAADRAMSDGALSTHGSGMLHIQAMLKSKTPWRVWIGAPLLVGVIGATVGAYSSSRPSSARHVLPVTAHDLQEAPEDLSSTAAPAAPVWSYSMTARMKKAQGDT